jgi:hypothetical protein
MVWLPFRAPERTPCEDLWRQRKGGVAADRAYHDGQALAERALAWLWLAALTPFDRLLTSGLLRSKFQWLST